MTTQGDWGARFIRNKVARQGCLLPGNVGSVGWVVEEVFHRDLDNVRLRFMRSVVLDISNIVARVMQLVGMRPASGLNGCLFILGAVGNENIRRPFLVQDGS